MAGRFYIDLFKVSLFLFHPFTISLPISPKLNWGTSQSSWLSLPWHLTGFAQHCGAPGKDLLQRGDGNLRNSQSHLGNNGRDSYLTEGLRLGWGGGSEGKPSLPGVQVGRKNEDKNRELQFTSTVNFRCLALLYLDINLPNVRDYFQWIK